MDEKFLELLAEGIRGAAYVLVNRIKEGEATAADIAQLRAMFRDAGGDLRFGNKPTAVGVDVLASMDDIDPADFLVN